MPKKCRIDYYPGEKALKRGSAAGGAALGSSGAVIAWYSSAGVFTKLGLALGVVSPPVALFAAVGAGGAVLAAGLVSHQLMKKDRAWAEQFLDD